jgi:DNA-binding response OmpR family regulator
MRSGERRLVLVVEDDEETRDILRLYLEKEGYEVLAAQDGDQGLKYALDRRPDIVLLDLMLPGIDGWELCRRLRTESKVPVLMLSARSQVDDRIEGFDLGADDYVAKPFSPREVVRRVRALLRRVGDGEPDQRIRFGNLEMDVERRIVRFSGEELRLTATEFAILETLMRSPRRVFSRETLVAHLGRDFEGYARSIDAHVGNLRRKLEACGAGRDVVQTVVGFGYRLGGHSA